MATDRGVGGYRRVERAINAVTGALFMAVGARLASEQQEAAERYRS